MNTIKKIWNAICEKESCFLAVLGLLLLGTYWTLIKLDPVFKYDDSTLLKYAGSISDFPLYVSLIKNGLVLDVQPVRDLSYFIDIKLKAFLPFYSFHLTNVIIWFFICMVVRRIFLLVRPSRAGLITLLVLMYALNPVSASSVAWIAARKHLLSTLFISLATYFSLKDPKKIFIIIFCYFLSCLSQPINCLWIIWLFALSFKQLKERALLLGTGLLVSLLTIAVNFYYYSTVFSEKVSIVSKFKSDVGDSLLALGRYIYQAFNPFAALPTSHYQGSWENLAGLGLLVAILFYLYKKFKAKEVDTLLPIIYFFTPLILVTANLTHIFCSDTYMLNSLIGFYWCLLLVFDQKRWALYLFAGLFICQGLYNLSYVKVFQNEDELWLYSHQKESTPNSSAMAASIFLKQKRFEDSSRIIDQIETNWPNQPLLPQLKAENIYYNPVNSPDQKIEKIKTITPKMPTTYFYLSLLYASLNNREGVKENVYSILKDPKNFNLEFRGNEVKVVARFYYLCEAFKLERCRESVDEFKIKEMSHSWSEKDLEESLAELKSPPKRAL